MSIPFSGIIPPALTPFDDQEEIDVALFQRDVEYLLSTGIDGVGVAGSTGEGAVLTAEEVGRTVAAAREVVGNKVPIIAGVIADSVRQAIPIGNAAKEAGADGLLITPVYYNGATEEGNFQYYQTLSAHFSLPVIVYNVVATNRIPPELMARLVELPNVVGVKQVETDLIGAMVNSCGANGAVYSAADNMLYPTYVAGCVGTISAIATVAPTLCVKQWNAVCEGDHATAREIHDQLGPVVASYLSRPFPGKVKLACQLQGRPMGTVRRPILPPTEEEARVIEAALSAAGLP